VSRAVRDFEDDIGVALFERGAFGVRPTDAGARFLALLTPAFREIRCAIAFARAAGRVETGSLRIGITASIAGGFLRSILDAYRREHPDIAMDIREGSCRDHVAAIHARNLDVAILWGSDEIAGCDSVRLWTEQMFVALAADHSLAQQATVDWPDLRCEHFLVPRCSADQNIIDYLVRRARELHAHTNIEFRDASQETLLHIAALGGGVTVVSEGWSYLAIPGVTFVPLSRENDVMPFRAVWSPRHDNPAMRRFLSFARERAQIRRS
jgi:DNA-binding transcriptional LysR family regulator